MNLKNTIVLGVTALMGFSIISHNVNAVECKKSENVQMEMSDKQVKAYILHKYKNAKHLTKSQLKELLWAVGFEGKQLKMAWSIAMAESNGRPVALNNSKRTGDSSYGLFQINMIGDLGPDRREKFNINKNSELLDPVKNAEVAYYMSKGGLNWSAWKHGNTPRAKQFLLEYKTVN